jgi:hypothetical protein
MKTETGFNAMGKPVPVNRLQKGYKAVKEILPNVENELAWVIANRCKNFIERDECSYLIGYTSLRELLLKELDFGGIRQNAADKYIAMIDLTGRYRLLAEMLTD